MVKTERKSFVSRAGTLEHILNAVQRVLETATTQYLRQWLRQSVWPTPTHTSRDLRSRTSASSKIETGPKFNKRATTGHLETASD